MEIEIVEIETFEQFEKVISIQKRIWHLSDRDLISTITLRALSMKYPIMGLMMGAYVSGRMVGFVICLPTREPNTLYGMIMGVLPEYQNSEVGNKMGQRILEKCLNQNVSKISWTYEPLESAHGHLYLNKWGGVVVKYEPNYYQLADEHNGRFPLDRFVVDCNLQSNRVIERISQKIKPLSARAALKCYPLAEKKSYPDSVSVMVRIPTNFKDLINNDIEKALNIRLTTRDIFNEYINNRSYFIAALLADEIDGKQQFYYLMEKRSYL